MADLNANKVDDMLEALNRAIEIHTKNAVQGLPYNKSELVEIVDITERNLGKYIVWNGSARYQAFSENTTYEMGTKVYVNIPNDDFKEQKHIIGPYVADGESAVFYRNPLTDFQPLTGNILQDKQVGEKKNGYDTTYGLVANYNKQPYYKVDIAEADYESNKYFIKNENDEYKLCDDVEFDEEKSYYLYDDKKSQVVEIYRAPDLSRPFKLEDPSDPNSKASLDLKAPSYQGYKYIGISAEFKTLLNTFSPIAGDYGIVVTIWHAVKYDVQEDAAIEKRDYFLSVKDMIGNVYNFNTYFKQAALYDISAFGEVQSIIVGFYQRGNFIMSNNKEVPTHYTLNGDSHLLSDNILVRNVSVTFGDDLMEHNDRATIFTRNGTTYDPVQKDILNTKTIELRWTHLNSTSDEFENLDSSKASSQCGNYKIHWYEDSIHDRTDYTTKAQSETDNAEAKMKAYKAWDKIETNQSEYTEDQIQEARLNLINTFNLKKGTDYTLSENGIINFISQIESRVNQVVSNAQSAANHSSSIAGDTLAGSGWKPIDVASTEWSIDFTPNYKRSYSKIMAIVEYDEGDTKHKIKSNILQFDNLRITSNSLSDDKANALRIGFSDGTDGDYPIYNGTTGELLSREDVTRNRKFQATCKSLIDNKDYLNGNETIIWQIPKTGSMILMNQTFLEENSSTLLDSTADEFKSFVGTLDYDAKYYYIKRSVSDSITAVNNEQTYQIAPYYNKANTNNTIYCYIIKNSDIFKGSASLTFGQHGTSGTDYTFTLGFIQKIAPKKDENNNIIKDGNGNELWGEVVGQGDTALTIGDENYLEIGFELFNSKNEKIDLTPEQKNAIIKLWVDKKNSENKVSIDGFYSGLSLDKKNNNITGNATKLVFITTKNGINYDRVAVKVHADTTDISELRYIVLQAAVTSKNVQNEESTLELVKFVQLLPIHVRAAGTDWILRGSDYIVYDDKGANPSCYNDYYQLFSPKYNTVLKAGFYIDSSDFDFNPTDVLKEERKRSYYPKLISFNKENNYSIDYKLQTTPLYVDSVSKEIVIRCGDEYICPLVILQNKYQIPAINNWNGELTVDNAGNKILASMIGAGHKNSDNTFTGVLMGDIVQKNSHTAKDETLTGLFGYLNGNQTFGFDTNGTAFIGKSDVGRIYIDGNNGSITSAEREAYNIQRDLYNEAVKNHDTVGQREHDDQDPRGIDFNLKDNYIDIQGVGNKARIHIDARGGADHSYLAVDNADGKRLLQIRDTGYYLQTANYSNNAGLKIDLANGTFDSKSMLTINGANGSSINFGDSENYIKLGINSGAAYFQMNKKGVKSGDAWTDLKNAWTALTSLKNGKNSFWDPEPSRNQSTYELDNKDNLQAQVTNFNKTITSKQNDLSTLNTNYGAKKSEKAGYENELSTAQAQREIDESQYRNFLAQWGQLNENSLNQSIAEQEGIIEEETGKIETINQNIETVTNTLEELQNDLSDLENRYHSQLSSLSSQISTLENDIANLNTSIEEKEREKTLTEQELATLEEGSPEYNVIQAKLNEIIQELNDLENEKALKSNQLADKKLELQTFKNETGIADIEDEIKDNEDDYNGYLGDLEECNEKIENAQNKIAEDQYALINLSNEKKRIGRQLNEIGLRILKKGQNLLVIDGENYRWTPMTSDGSLWITIDNLDTKIKAINLSQMEEEINTAEQELNRLINLSSTASEKIEDYENAYNLYNSAINGTGSNFISINNTEEIRLNVGDVFKVDKKGKLTAANADIKGNINATSGNLKNVTVETLNFKQDDGNIVKGIKPQWMTFVTDVTGSCSTGKVGVSATVSDTVNVPYSYTAYDTLENNHVVVGVNGEGASLHSYTGTSGGGWNWRNYVSPHNQGTKYEVDIYIPSIVSNTYTKTASVPYKATITGTTDVPVVKSITLTVWKISMWALTNVKNPTPDPKTILSSGWYNN